MPELPDITLYIEALSRRLQNAVLESVTLGNPFFLRTVVPATDTICNRKLAEIRRVGKRLAFQFDNDHWMVIHLMIAGRFQWVDKDGKNPKRKTIAQFNFNTGTLLLTEAGSKRRASMYLFESESGMLSVDRGGLEIDSIALAQFSERLTLRNHTLKRALTDQSLFSGIGNAYSDEILHHAKQSPVRQTQKMSDAEIKILFTSCKYILRHWTEKLRAETGNKFPAKVTAFKSDMAVHGRYELPCPECDTRIQRIRYKSNETNYCPRCQNGGKLLADRSLSRLLKKDWPKTIEELEEAQHPVPCDKNLDNKRIDTCRP